MVLGGSESVGHTLQAVYYGTGKVICWVDSGKRRRKKHIRNLIIYSLCFDPNKSWAQLLICVSGAGVGGVLAAKQGGVPHTAIVGLHVHLGPHAAGLTLLGASFHFCPHLHVLLHGYKAQRCSSVKLQMTISSNGSHVRDLLLLLHLDSTRCSLSCFICSGGVSSM